MRSDKTFVFRQLNIVVVSILATMLLLSPIAKAQTGNEGLNAVYGPSSAIQASSAFIDAKPYLGSGDICAALNTVILDVVGVGAVIDARGINPGTTQSCAQSPWHTPPSS